MLRLLNINTCILPYTNTCNTIAATCVLAYIQQLSYMHAPAIPYLLSWLKCSKEHL